MECRLGLVGEVRHQPLGIDVAINWQPILLTEKQLQLITNIRQFRQHKALQCVHHATDMG